jgi:hypothetical protein
MTILDQYFRLSDQAWFQPHAAEEIINLFSEEAEVQPVGAPKVKGRQAIEQLFRSFFDRYASLRRVWRVSDTPQGMEATWAVAGRYHSGEVFAVHGKHIAKLDEEGKIAKLQVELITNPT